MQKPIIAVLMTIGITKECKSFTQTNELKANPKKNLLITVFKEW
jgi:hypothetical protein